MAADERDALRDSLRELLKRPPRQDKIPGVMSARKFKEEHGKATKLVDKAAATTQQLTSAIETIRAYVGERVAA